MISALRAFAKSPFALILIGLLVASFALWGVPDMFRGGGTAVAIVGPQQVSVRDFREAYDQEMQTIQQQDPTFTRQQAREFGLPEQVLQRLVVEAALNAKAQELGMGVSRNSIAAQLSEFDAFRSPITGRFDKQTAEEVLARNRQTLDRFEEIIGAQMTRGQLVAPFFAGVTPPDDLARTRYAYEEERRAVRGMIFPPVDAAEIEDPGDEALTDVIIANQDFAPGGYPVFAHPERRAFTLVRFRVADYAADVEIDESELRELHDYQLETGAIGTPATRSWVQVRFPDSESASAAADRIAAGEDAVAVSAELGGEDPFSQDEQESYQVPDEALREALFEMNAGEARAVEGVLGWFVVQITEAVDAEIPSFEDRVEELRVEYARAEAEDAMFGVMGLFDAARSEGSTLEQAAAAAGAVVEIFPAIDAFGLNEDGQPAMTLRTEQGVEILRMLFETIPGVPLELETYGDGDYYTMRIDDVVDARPRGLDEARGLALAYWRQQESDRVVSERVEAALDRLNAGEDFQLVADEAGARVESTTTQRDETAGQFGAAAVGIAFAIDAGEPIETLGADQRTQMILVVDDVIAADPDAAELGALTVLDTAIGGALANDLAIELQAALLAEYGYTQSSVDQRLLAIALGENPDDP